jgi:hypothetical protein
MLGAETADHHGDHRRLLWPADEATPRAKFDAIIVPTTRPVAYLKEAARAARYLGCPLVMLHSPGRTSASQSDAHLGRWLDLIAAAVQAPAHLRLPALETSRLLAGTIFERRTDVSTKRNLALLLAHMLRWERVAFPDDHIRVPDPADLSRAVSFLDTPTTVGLRIEGPDNSVVCHAFREAGGRQKTFIGGGALAVDVKRNRTFFPNIYNEDWFFDLDERKRLQPAAAVGEVPQEPYDPYRPARARAEELGDVLAEGICWLLDQERSASDGDLAHWRNFLTRRWAEALNPAPGPLARWLSPLSRLLWGAAYYERPWLLSYFVALSTASVRGVFATATAAPLDVSMIELLTPGANFQAEVSNALLRFNLRKLTWAEARERKILDFTAATREVPQYEGICKLIRHDLQSFDPAELYAMLRHLGFRITPSRQHEEAKQDQRLAFLHALIRIRLQQKRGVETRSSLSLLQSEPPSRQASTRDRMTASSHSLRGPTFPTASWPTRGTAIAA